jgi:hypothetical protein
VKGNHQGFREKILLFEFLFFLLLPEADSLSWHALFQLLPEEISKKRCIVSATAFASPSVHLDRSHFPVLPLRLSQHKSVG